MSIPKEPRQIMINLMYLVLTALLALNVSNEIINAFKVLAAGITDSNLAIDRKTQDVYNQIKENENEAGQAAKVKPYREKADEVVKRSNEMIAYMDEWKEKIVKQAGGRNEDKEIKSPENIDATTLLLVEEHGADQLKKKITDMRKFYLESVRPDDSSAISPIMPLRISNPPKSDNNPKGEWDRGYFEHMPAIAAMAMFAKFQNDVRSSEALVITKLYEEAHLKELKFDTIAAVAVPKTSYALQGQKIEASILLAAFNKANRPTVTITQGGGQKKEPVNGVVAWETVASGTGLQTVKGTIRLETADPNNPTIRPWTFDYTVGTTGASMQLDKMNVFYIGVDNPVTVAAAGYSVEDVSLAIPDATIKGEKGHYVINVTKPGNVDVSINAKTAEGQKKVGGMLVRVKRIPNPIAKLNGATGGGMGASLFRAQIAPAAILENFEFDAKFTIISFSYSLIAKGRDLEGPYIVQNRAGCRLTGQGANPNIETSMKRAKAGDKVVIEDIKAVGPDGQVRSLGIIFFTLN
jgi:gliding motility-associated protein GldM